MQKKSWLIASLVALVAVLVDCSKDRADGGVNAALPTTVPSPAGNPLTTQKAALGRLLFFDPVLSGNKDVACATCHHPSLGFADGRDLPIGVNGQGLGLARHFLSPNSIPFVKRNSLSIVNTAFNGISTNGLADPSTAAMFFDNRTRSLELQSLEPMRALEEMRGRAIAPAAVLDSVILRLQNIPPYVQLFSDAFGTANAITVQNLGKAIASYERTIVANNSPYDKYMRGDKSAMTAQQIQGMNDFTSSGCNRCHSGPMFSDYQLHVLSVPDNPKLPTDAGTNGTYAFRTPSLRNLSLTGPYMHSGVFTSLNAVLDFYERVGDHRSQNAHVSNNQLDGNLQGLGDRNKASIILFLNALNDTNFDKTIPVLVPSGLHPGGSIQ